MIVLLRLLGTATANGFWTIHGGDIVDFLAVAAFSTVLVLALYWVYRVVPFSQSLRGEGIVLRFFLTLMLGVFGVICIVSGLALGGLLGLMTFAVLMMCITQYFRTRQRSLLAAMALAAEKGLPLAPTIEAFAEEHPGIYGRRALKLARLLRAGVPLATAIEQVRGILPPQAILAVRLGEQSSSLGPALREVSDRYVAQQPLRRIVAGRVTYVVNVLLIMAIIMVFITIKLVPAFVKIFDDFDVPLPPLTIFLISSLHFLENSGALLAVLVILCLGASYALLSFMGWIEPGTFGLSRFFIRLDRAAILRTLSLAVERGRPLRETLQALATWYPKRFVRQKLVRADAALGQGQPWQQGLRTVGLIGATDVAILSTAERAGNLAWALREAADSNERRFLYRMDVLGEILFPMSILALGFVVMLVVVAYFMPLIVLIRSLA